MKKFKFTLVSFVIAIAMLIGSSILSSSDKTPDAGIAYFVTAVLLSLILIGLAILLDFFLALTSSKKEFVSKRRGFWRIIGVAVIAGIIYVVYMLGST